MKLSNLFKILCLVLVFSLGISPAYAIKYTYDNLGRLTIVEYENQTLNFGYDAGGNLLKINAPPIVKNTDPVKGATAVLVGKTIAIMFSEDIQQGSNFSGISVKKGENEISFARR